MGRDADPSAYAVTLECGIDGSCLGWVDELPGCAVRGASREEVLSRLPSAISEFIRWTGRGSGAEPVAIGRVQEVESRVETDEDTEALLDVDRGPLTRTEWDATENSLAKSRGELLEFIETLTQEDLGIKRPGSERTVQEEIEHIAFVEFMYAVWTFDLQSPRGLAGFLEWTRDIATRRLSVLADRRSDSLTWADWGGAPELEPWTAKKAARRLIWHELLHLRQLEHRDNANPS